MKAALLALAAILASSTLAHADEDAPTVGQKMRFTDEDDGWVHATASIAKLFDSAAYEALGSGFESTILIRMWVYKKGSSDPVSFQVLERKVVYDIWDEVYEIQLDGPGGRQNLKVKYRAEALKLLSSLDAVPIIASDDMPYKAHFRLSIVAELNPVDEETLAEVRRWLTEGSGGGLDRGGSLFGSVVSVFVNPKIEDADRVLKLRSQPFFRNPPAEGD